MTSASRTGLQLDPNDPTDRKIMGRQQRVAVQAGREGQDRAAVTRGRADLEGAYDAGAAETAGAHFRPYDPAATGGQSAAKPSAARRAAGKDTNSGPSWAAFKPRSPARLPSRMQDAGGFLSGLALYTVVIIYIRYGPEGWKGWLAAKFVNKPMDATGVTGALGTKPTSPSGKSRLV